MPHIPKVGERYRLPWCEYAEVEIEEVTDVIVFKYVGIGCPTSVTLNEWRDDMGHPRQSTCSRCPECQGRTHHWAGNCYFGNLYAPPPMRENSHECKHCDALGDECCDCQGAGKVENEAECPLCKGEGVVLSPGVGWTDWMAIKW